MAKTRRKYKGNATATTIPSGLAAGASLCTVAAATGWPTAGPFYAVIDPGSSTEEKILVGSISGTSLSSITRGVDDTTDQTHQSGCSIYPVFTAVDADEANELASTWTTKGDLVTHGSSTFARLAAGTNNHVLMADSTQAAGLKYAQVGENSLASDAVTTAKIADSAVTSAKIANGTIVDADINASAAVALSKLATGALPTGITVASDNLVDGTIVDADINASAAIALSKLATGALPTAITVASANIVNGTIVNDDVNANAAIALSKLETSTSGNVIVHNASGVPTAVALSGDATISNAGVLTIASGAVTSGKILDGTIVDGDINASAGIALTKLASGTAGRVVMYNASGVATATALSGDVTISNTGVTTVGANTLNGTELASSAVLDITGITTSGNIKTGGTFKTDNTSSGTYLEFQNGSISPATLFRVDAQFGIYGNGQTGTLRAVSVNSAGTVGYNNTSSVRFKKDITPYEFDEEALISLEPKRFKYKDDFLDDPTEDVWQYGFIAEEARDLGFPELLQYDATGEPDYFAYERMCVAQQQLIRTLWSKVQSLEARLDALEAK